MRINKLMSNAGICSRKETTKLIKENRILVNGKLCTQGQWVEWTDEILLDNELVTPKEMVYIILNKPRGILCTSDTNKESNIITYLNYDGYVFPVGRLDKESEGLILMTSDGELANKVLSADYEHEKEYIVTVDKDYDDEFLYTLSQGVKIFDDITKPCITRKINSNTFSIILSQGLNRQIRKMCKKFAYNVTKLRRIRIVNLSIDNLDYGTWRHLTSTELNSLKEKLENA